MAVRISNQKGSDVKRCIICLIVLIACPSWAQVHKGEIVGKVLDSKTQEPLPSVNVIVLEKPGAGAATDLNGSFRISGLDVGTYSLQVSAIGFVTQIVTNVVITTGRPTPVAVRLDETTIEMQGVTVQANYFSRGQQMAPVSSNAFDRAEVLRSPGGVQDVQRVAQNLPGVASSTDNINELIVRGGAPYENLTIMDHMEIPSINHYSSEFNSAGPINMVNADMIEDVQFSTGGFPAQYGDKTSSVMNLTVREGDRTKAFASKTAMNMAGIGTLVEGGYAEGRGSYIISARNSLLEFLDKVVGISAISLTAIPKYWDTQAKIVYDLSRSQKLSLNVLYGDSRISIEGDPNEKDELRKNAVDSSSVQSLSPVTKQYALGLSLRSLFGKDGFSDLTLYSSGVSNEVDVQEDFAVRVRGAEGEVLSYRILNSRRVFHNHSIERFVGAKYELLYQIHPLHELSVGGQVQTALEWSNDVFAMGDTSRYDLNRDGLFEAGPIALPPWAFTQEFSFASASKYFVYLSDRIRLAPRVALMLGLRYDHFTYSGQGALSPRASISYQIFPSVTTITCSVGEYSQTHPLPYYGDRANTGLNAHLPDMKASHVVLGLEHVLDRGLKLSLETYYKRYKRIAVAEDFAYSANDTFWSDRTLAAGERSCYGLELLLEQKQVEDLFGTLSVSLSKSIMKDPRIPPLVDHYPSDFDYPVIVTALGGKVVKGVRDWLNSTPFFLRYPSYLLPLSNEMEISLKFRYQTGRPYTRQEFVVWKQEREGGVKWSRGAWIGSSAVNAARYPDYRRLDIQWLSRFYLRQWNINVYVALMNVFNTKNVFFENYRSDGTKETVYQFAFFPVGGVEVEF